VNSNDEIYIDPALWIWSLKENEWHTYIEDSPDECKVNVTKGFISISLALRGSQGEKMDCSAKTQWQIFNHVISHTYICIHTLQFKRAHLGMRLFFRRKFTKRHEKGVKKVPRTASEMH